MIAVEDPRRIEASACTMSADCPSSADHEEEWLPSDIPAAKRAAEAVAAKRAAKRAAASITAVATNPIAQVCAWCSRSHA